MNRYVALVLTFFLLYVVTKVSLITAGVSYDGYRLLNVQVNSSLDVEWMQRIADEYAYNRKVDIWLYPTMMRPHLHVLLAPDILPLILKLLIQRGLSYHIAIDSVDSVIAASGNSSRKRKRRHSSSPRYSTATFPFDDYHSFEEIELWLRKLNATRSRSFDLSSLGKTAEGRHIWMAKISSQTTSASSAAQNRPKPAVFLDAGMHAREWISHAVALYLIKSLLHYQRHNDDESSIWRSIDWYLAPVVNPDGYAYSTTADRLWRKNRSTPTARNNNNNSTACRGVDINRNFDFHFGEVGSSTVHACSNVYAGPYAMSEAETESVAAKLRQLAPTLKSYISLHSYGQLWLVPWGYRREKPNNYQRQGEVARKAMAALRRVNQTEYAFGTIANLMYPASGTSVDYAHSLGIPFSLALELRPEDSDTTHGFLYPPEYILPTGKETWEALKIVAKEIINNNNF